MGGEIEEYPRLHPRTPLKVSTQNDLFRKVQNYDGNQTT